MSATSQTESVEATGAPPFGLLDVAVLGVILIWGGNFTIVKYAFDEIQPLIFNALRFTLAAALMCAIVRLGGGDLRVARRDWPGLIVLALIGNGLHQIGFVKGLALTRVGNSSLLIATNPIFIALLGAAIGIERITRRMWLGIALSFVGMAVVIAHTGQGFSLGSETLSGDLLSLSAAVTWAIYAVFSRPLLLRYEPLKFTALTMAISTPFLWLAAIPELGAQAWEAISWRGWGGVAFSFVFSLGIGYLIYYRAMQRIGNARTSNYNNLMPVVAFVVAALTLREPIVAGQVLGAAIVLIGIYLTRSTRTRRPAAGTLSRRERAG